MQKQYNKPILYFIENILNSNYVVLEKESVLKCIYIKYLKNIIKFHASPILIEDVKNFILITKL